MATPVILPKFGMTMEEATIERWLRQEGDRVEAGDPLVEVMTEKVNMEVESPAAGVLGGVRAKPGDVVPVTHVIAYILQPGEQAPAEPPPARGTTAAQAAAPAAPASATPHPSTDAQTIAATPVARRLARDAGLDLAAVRGTGPGGRITEDDVRAAIAARDPARQPLRGRRRVIAQRVSQSAREIPHIYLTRTVEMSAVAAGRGDASYTAVIVWAAARALRGHPLMRTSLDGDLLATREAIHVGVAVDTPEGLIVPVARDADRKEPDALHREIADLARRARDGGLRPDEVGGAAFTISNLGMLGVDRFTALIDPPQSALLAVGAVRPRPWAAGDALVVRPTCDLTLAVDHRVADGAAGARFLEDLCRMLETYGR